MPRTKYPIKEDATAERSCSGCGHDWPRTSEYWPRDEHSPDGLGYRCRACRSADTMRSRKRKAEREAQARGES